MKSAIFFCLKIPTNGKQKGRNNRISSHEAGGRKAEDMRITIEISEKEVAALVSQVQGRRSGKSFAEIFSENSEEYKAIISQKAKRDTDREAQ